MVGATSPSVRSARAAAVASAWIWSAPSGRCGPCASRAPTGRMTRGLVRRRRSNDRESSSLSRRVVTIARTTGSRYLTRAERWRNSYCPRRRARNVLACGRVRSGFDARTHGRAAAGGAAGVAGPPLGGAVDLRGVRARGLFLGGVAGTSSATAGGGAAGTGGVGAAGGAFVVAFRFRAGAFFAALALAALARSAFLASWSAFFCRRVGHSGLMQSVHGGRPASIAVTTGAWQVGQGG